MIRALLALVLTSLPALCSITYGVQAIAPPGAAMTGPAGQAPNGMLIGTDQSFVYNNGNLSDGGFLPLGFSPTGLTDNGTVTGQFLLQVSVGLQGASYTQGYFYNGSGWFGIENPFANDSASSVGMASNGSLVGNAFTPSGTSHAIVWQSNGTWIDLNSLASGYSNITAQAVNSSGLITGSADGKTFISNGSTITTLNDPASLSSTGNAISSDSRVAGSRILSGGVERAFVTDSLGVITDLGTLGGLNSSALGLNALGAVVGWSLNSSGQQRAFLYSNGVMTDLNTLLTVNGEWLIQSAIAINQSGIILATAVNAFGEYRTVLLTPEVPEPSSHLLSVLGLSMLFGRRFLNRKNSK
jgi:probable HAF family extracellular repeat protein